MKNYILIFLLLFTFCNAYSQHKVIDIETKKPIAYAHVKIVNISKGIITNYHGQFYLDSTFNNYDTLKISCIGYKDKLIAIRDLKNLSTIELTQQVQVLNSVSISAKKLKYKQKKIGVVKNPRTLFIDYSVTADNGVEKATWIPNKYSIIGFLKSINVYITDVGYPDAHFRVHVYDCSPFEIKPGKELTMSNIVVSGTEVNEWLSIDMVKENIQISENGCFIGIEWFDSPKSLFYRDTIKWKGVTRLDENMKDTIYNTVREGNGVVLGSVSEQYKYAKNKIWHKDSTDGEWINITKLLTDESKFNIPDTLAPGFVRVLNETNYYFSVPCINAEISFPKEKLKTVYQDPKKRKLNKIEKTKQNLFKYPQSNVNDLFYSLIFAFENNEIIYLLKYLCVYEEDQLKDIIDDLSTNKERSGDYLNNESREGAIRHLEYIKQHLEESTLSKIGPQKFILKVGEYSYHLIVKDGLWKINPYTYKIQTWNI